MRNNGYFSFNKEYISFIADTVAGSKQVGLTMVVHKPQNLPRHRRYIYSKVTVVTNFSPGATPTTSTFQTATPLTTGA